MKNEIAYYYNLYSYDIHHYKDVYKFTVDNVEYVLSPCNPSEINDIYLLNQKLLHQGLCMHQIIPNNAQAIYTKINNVDYVLVRITGIMNRKLELSDIIYFTNLTTSIRYDRLNQQKWCLLWEEKVDYFEYQVNQFGKKYPKIRDSFSYYIGIIETGISLCRNININAGTKSVCHKRLNHKSTLYDLYNPLNIVIDYRVRDTVEYFKDLFLLKDDIFNDIVDYLKKEQLSTYDLVIFFIRMFYPSFYFDMYEEIINNKIEEERIDFILSKSKSYELLLKKIYIYLLNYIQMPDIEWLKKT